MNREQLIKELGEVELTPENVATVLLHCREERDQWKAKLEELMTRHTALEDDLEVIEDLNSDMAKELADIEAAGGIS